VNCGLRIATKNRRSRGLRLFRLVATIGERFGEMAAADGGRIVKIGDGAGKLEDAMETAGREIETLGGLAQQSETCGVGPRGVFDDRARCRGIGCDAGKPQFGVAFRLAPPRGCDAQRNFGRSFGRCRQHQIGGAHCRDLDRHIDAIEQRAREPRLILPDASRNRLPVAAIAGIERMAAAAGVHRSDELKTRRINGPVIGARDGDFAGFERLTQTVQNLRMEFRKFIQK
jgi:hypothetical protein